MKHAFLTDEEISRMKWQGIPKRQLTEFEARQRERIKVLEDLLQREREELRAIMEEISGSSTQHVAEFGSASAPPRYSTRMTWKDKIILVVREAKRPLLAREIGPVLIEWEPVTLSYTDIDNTVSVHLSKLVRDGGLIRIKRKGQSGSLYALPE